MIAWQAELGNAAEVFDTAERARARALIDEMALGGVDLLAGITSDRANDLRSRDAAARTHLADLQHRPNGSPLELASARQAVYEIYRDIRNASPAYRSALAQDRKPVALAALQEWARKHDAVVALYLLGDERSDVLVVPPAGEKPRLEKLIISAAEAEALGTEAGPLTVSRLQAILFGAKTGGLLQRLSAAGSNESLVAQLAALWRVLVPDTERKAILAGKLEHLVIVPDGPLALFPFEALVVEETKEPKFLLDAGPPIAYAPSATVLYNLSERSALSLATDREPVLAIGDPAYGEAGATDPVPKTTLAALTSRSQYSSVGGRLSRLPYSGAEVRSVVKDFSEAGINTASLTGTTATERGVRYWSSGRRVLHLACHGLADQKYGNFFGALALTPGPKGSENPADDGFLTLPEIYELNLKGCELAILSACQTNYGPQQKGEGIWALSRGFLVAGSRRVVASNWLVDDEAAAGLVHYFCAGLARAEKDGKPVDHAMALQAAKRWVRQQDKWKSPYYWASMVLIGPP